MRSLIRILGLILISALLLIIIVPAILVSTDDNAEEAEEVPLGCLALVGGTALLAGAAWVATLRRMPS